MSCLAALVLAVVAVLLVAALADPPSQDSQWLPGHPPEEG